MVVPPKNMLSFQMLIIKITRLVRKGANNITRCISDGANYVGMIQAAHVGVRISGLEGMKAVMANDFTIAKSRFLKDLLLVHGGMDDGRILNYARLFLTSFTRILRSL